MFHLRAARSLVLGLLMLLVCSVPAAAAPPDAPWSASASTSFGPAMTSTIVNDGSGSAAVLSYDNNAPGVGGSGASAQVEFETIATATRSVTLSYNLNGFHAFFLVTVRLEAYIIDPFAESEQVIPLINAGPASCCDTPSAGFDYSGQVTLNVQTGQLYGFRISGSNGDLNSRLLGTLTVDDAGTVEPEVTGAAVLMQAVPAGAQTFIAAQLIGPALASRTLQLLTSDLCEAGVLGAEPAVFAEVEVTFDAMGEAFLAGPVANVDLLQTYAGARLLGETATGPTSACIVAGPDNDSWVRAADIVLAPSGDVLAGGAQGFIDAPGKARWFRFAISPGSRVQVELSGLPADYDLAVFKDIGQAYVELGEDEDTDGLNRLSAEFAPSVFSPSVFSPSVFSPSVFSPDAYAPSVFSPSVFSPSVFSPSVFSPSVFSPSVFSPSVFSPSVFSPSVFSPSVFSPSVFSPDTLAPSVFSPENFSSAQTRSLIAVSAQPGTGTERVVADTWNNTGFFYVRVAGKGDAANVELPFTVAVTSDGTQCDNVAPVSAPQPINAVANDYRAIILMDSEQMRTAPEYSGADVATLRARLNTLAARPEVRGVVIDLAGFGDVQFLHSQSADADACPYAENLTAAAIKRIIDAYRAANPSMRYIVLAGNDAVIPFFRYPDQSLLGPEQDYDPPMANGTQSQSALRLNYILGQDEYGASTVLSLRDGNFPIPDLAVGRLVETVPEMVRVVDAYLNTPNGVVPTPTSSLVTGYDFLTDNADAVQEELVAGTLNARNDTLITDADVSPDDLRPWTADRSNAGPWTADNLRQKLLPNRSDIIFLAGHFSANSTLAADYKTTMLVTELASSGLDLTNAIVFSGGCHSGYNIVNGDAVPNVTLQLDWAQAFAQKGATLVAGTGYQYGDTDFIEYSERLYVRFARELRTGTGAVSVGEALVRAKQHYLATTPDIRGLHRKSVLISTVFGLPMTSVNMPGQRVVDESMSVPVTPTVVETGTPGSVLGLEEADVTLAFAGDLDTQTVDLTVNLLNSLAPKLQATYLRGPDGVVTNPAEPAIPLVSKDVSVAGRSLRGVGFRGGYWSEQPVVPLTGAPATELRGVHTPFASLVNFPMRLATPNYLGALSRNGGTLLHVTPVQHRVASIGDVNAIQRRFDELQFRLYYSSNTQTYLNGNRPALAAPPTLAGVRADVAGPDVRFQVRVVGSPAAGIQTVWVTWTDASGNQGQWQPLDLTQSPTDSTLWTGVLPGGASLARLVYQVQAVNGVGLVTADDNYGSNYTVAGTGGPSGALPASTVVLSGPTGSGLPSSAVHGSSLNLEAVVSGPTGPVYDVPVLFSLGATGLAARTDANGVARVALPVNAVPGQYVLSASFGGTQSLAGSAAQVPFQVTKASTVLTIQTGAQTVGVDGVASGVTARLTDGNGAALLQRTVYFTLTGGPDGVVTVPAITNNFGVATLGDLALPARTYTLTARFLGTVPTAGAPLVLTDPVYQSSSASRSFALTGKASCPTTSVKGKLDLTGFCYLTRPVDGKITITNGTLIVGGETIIQEDGTVVENTTSIDQKIDQIGTGSVHILRLASVRGAITESGLGDIVVHGSVGGNLKESGSGYIVIRSTGRVDGNIDELDPGSVIVRGYVNGHVREFGAGDVIVTSTGQITRTVTENGEGTVRNDGTVSGTVTQF